MFSKGDKVELIESVFGFGEVGQICTITEINDKSNYIVYEFDDNHFGMMDIGTFEKCFKKCEEPKPKHSVDSEYVNWLVDNSEIEVFTTHNKCTIVSCKLPNGFVITESSSCVDPKNYDKNLGTKICISKIINKIWELEGYLLQNEIWSLEEEYDYDCEHCEDYDCQFNSKS